MTTARLSKVENIVRSFTYALEHDKIVAKMENTEFDPYWFCAFTGRNSVLLGVVSDEEEKELLNYGISTEKENDYAEYKIVDFHKFEDAIA